MYLKCKWNLLFLRTNDSKIYIFFPFFIFLLMGVTKMFQSSLVFLILNVGDLKRNKDEKYFDSIKYTEHCGGFAKFLALILR